MPFALMQRKLGFFPFISIKLFKFRLPPKKIAKVFTINAKKIVLSFLFEFSNF
jgi:hypothetical protein